MVLLLLLYQYSLYIQYPYVIVIVISAVITIIVSILNVVIFMSIWDYYHLARVLKVLGTKKALSSDKFNKLRKKLLLGPLLGDPSSE